MTQETITLLAGAAGTALAAFTLAMRKINGMVGTVKPGEESIRDLVIKIDGKLDGTNERIERLDHRLTLVEADVFPEEPVRAAVAAKQ